MSLDEVIKDTVRVETSEYIKENLQKILLENNPDLFKPTQIVIKDKVEFDFKDEVLHASFPDVIAAVNNNIPVWLVGEAGTGKTQLSESVAKALKLDFYPLSVCAQTTASMLYGYMNATGTYVGTHFRKAYEQGGLFLLDEVDNGNANVLSVLNSALSNGYCSFPDAIVKRHENFRLIASGNTYGTGADRMYVGRNEIDAATLDRFVFIAVGYDPNIEKFAMQNESVYAFIKNVRDVISQKQIRHIVSTRAGIYLHKLLLSGLDYKEAIDISVFKNLDDESIKVIKGANVAYKDLEKSLKDVHKPKKTIGSQAAIEKIADTQMKAKSFRKEEASKAFEQMFE
jgi:cobaltochelatase CobS